MYSSEMKDNFAFGEPWAVGRGSPTRRCWGSVCGNRQSFSQCRRRTPWVWSRRWLRAGCCPSPGTGSGSWTRSRATPAAGGRWRTAALRPPPVPQSSAGCDWAVGGRWWTLRPAGWHALDLAFLFVCLKETHAQREKRTASVLLSLACHSSTFVVIILFLISLIIIRRDYSPPPPPFPPPSGHIQVWWRQPAWERKIIFFVVCWRHGVWLNVYTPPSH